MNQELKEKSLLRLLKAEASQKSNDLMDKGRAELALELLKWLEEQATGDDIMILSRTAYNKGFADAMSGDNFHRIYKDDKRHADYSHGFQMGIQEYES